MRNGNFSDIILNLKILRSAKTLNLIQSLNYVTGKLNLSWVTLVNRQYYLCLCLQDPKVMLEVLLFPLMGNTIMHNLRCIVLITFCKRSNKLQRDNLTSYILHVPLLSSHHYSQYLFNPLNPELNPICYLPALLGAHNFLHVRRIRVKLLTFRRLVSYIYIWH